MPTTTKCQLLTSSDFTLEQMDHRVTKVRQDILDHPALQGPEVNRERKEMMEKKGTMAQEAPEVPKVKLEQRAGKATLVILAKTGLPEKTEPRDQPDLKAHSDTKEIMDPQDRKVIPGLKDTPAQKETRVVTVCPVLLVHQEKQELRVKQANLAIPDKMENQAHPANKDKRDTKVPRARRGPRVVLDQKAAGDFQELKALLVPMGQKVLKVMLALMGPPVQLVSKVPPDPMANQDHQDPKDDQDPKVFPAQAALEDRTVEWDRLARPEKSAKLDPEVNPENQERSARPDPPAFPA